MRVYDTDMEVQENKNRCMEHAAAPWGKKTARVCGNISCLCHMIIDTDV